MTNVFRDVREFNSRSGSHKDPTSPTAMIRKKIALCRWDLVSEEIGELRAAMTNLHEIVDKEAVGINKTEILASVSDATCDLIYVLVGNALAYGIDLEPIWVAIHAANMKKDPNLRDANGKIMKPEGWVHTDIRALIEEQLHV